MRQAQPRPALSGAVVGSSRCDNRTTLHRHSASPVVPPSPKRAAVAGSSTGRGSQGSCQRSYAAKSGDVLARKAAVRHAVLRHAVANELADDARGAELAGMVQRAKSLEATTSTTATAPSTPPVGSRRVSAGKPREAEWRAASGGAGGGGDAPASSSNSTPAGIDCAAGAAIMMLDRSDEDADGDDSGGSCSSSSDGNAAAWRGPLAVTPTPLFAAATGAPLYTSPALLLAMRELRALL